MLARKSHVRKLSNKYSDLGRIILLMAQQPGYKRWPLEKILYLIAPCIQDENYDIEIDNGGAATSCALWAYMSTKGRDWYLDNNGAEIPSDKGDEVIITHFLSTTGAIPYMKKVLQLIGRQNKKTTHVYGLRGFKNNRVCKLPIIRR